MEINGITETFLNASFARKKAFVRNTNPNKLININNHQ
jgi:hypothetical protein